MKGKILFFYLCLFLVPSESEVNTKRLGLPAFANSQNPDEFLYGSSEDTSNRMKRMGKSFLCAKIKRVNAGSNCEEGKKWIGCFCLEPKQKAETTRKDRPMKLWNTGRNSQTEANICRPHPLCSTCSSVLLDSLLHRRTPGHGEFWTAFGILPRYLPSNRYLLPVSLCVYHRFCSVKSKKLNLFQVEDNSQVYCCCELVGTGTIQPKRPFLRCFKSHAGSKWACNTGISIHGRAERCWGWFVNTYFGRSKQISAQFSDIREDCYVVPSAVLPEMCDRKFSSKDQCCPWVKKRVYGNEPRIIKRESACIL